MLEILKVRSTITSLRFQPRSKDVLPSHRVALPISKRKKTWERDCFALCPLFNIFVFFVLLSAPSNKHSLKSLKKLISGPGCLL